MTPWVLVLLALAGGAGAVLRFVLDGVVSTRNRTRLPLGTVVINLTGSFVLGAVTGLALVHLVPGPLRLIVGTGFLGGYTTLSAASVEAARLSATRPGTAGLVLLLAVPAAAVALAALGLLAGTAF